jgi:hypothetical protein
VRLQTRDWTNRFNHVSEPSARVITRDVQV